MLRAHDPEDRADAWQAMGVLCDLMLDDADRGIVAESNEGDRRSGLLVMHERWHVARGVRSPDCELCREAA